MAKNVKPTLKLSVPDVNADEAVVAARGRAAELSARLARERATVASGEARLRDETFLARATDADLDKLVNDVAEARARIPLLETQLAQAAARRKAVEQRVAREAAAAVVRQVTPAAKDRVTALVRSAEATWRELAALEQFYAELFDRCPGLDLVAAGLPVLPLGVDMTVRGLLLFFLRRQGSTAVLGELMPRLTVEPRMGHVQPE